MATVATVNGRVDVVRDTKAFQTQVGAQILDQDTIIASPESLAKVKYTGEQTTITLLSSTTAKL